MFQKKIEKILQRHNYEFFHIKSTTSTMYDARNFIKSYKKNCIYLSDIQTNGKGQRGNFWHSPKGNIYCSISFDNFLQTKEHFLFSVLISISIKMSLEKFNVDKVCFKWPNDIFYKRKKFAGIISEIININEIKHNIITGFGINFVSSSELYKYNATYIKSFSKIKSIQEFFLVFINILFMNLEKLQQGKKNQLMKFFSESLLFINEKINIVSFNRSKIKGICRGINDDGSLKLEIDGKIKNIYNGSIVL